MPVNIGTAGVKEIYIGNQKVKEVYIGTQRVFGRFYERTWEFNDFGDIQLINSRYKGRNKLWAEDGYLKLSGRNGSVEGSLNYTFGYNKKARIRWNGEGVIILTLNNGSIFSVYSSTHGYVGYEANRRSDNAMTNVNPGNFYIFEFDFNNGNVKINVKNDGGTRINGSENYSLGGTSYYLNFFQGSNSTMLIDYIDVF